MFRRALEKKRAGEGGFTLVELLIVIVILGILAAIVVLAIGGLSGSATSASCNSGVHTIESAEDAYYASPDATGNAQQVYGDTDHLLNTGGVAPLSGKLLKADPRPKLAVAGTATNYTITSPDNSCSKIGGGTGTVTGP
jgi:prepilin-type N-terminal cleavage/methylation domain-containing protein